MVKKDNPFYEVKDSLRNDDLPRPLKDLLRYDSTEMLGKLGALHAALFGLDRPKPRPFAKAPAFERVDNLRDCNLGAQSLPNQNNRLTIRYSGFVADKIQEKQDDYHRRIYGTHFALTHIAVELVEAEPSIEERIADATKASASPLYDMEIMRWRAASALALKQVDSDREKRLLPGWYRSVRNDVTRVYLGEALAAAEISEELGVEMPNAFSEMPPQILGLLDPFDDAQLERLTHRRRRTD